MRDVLGSSPIRAMCFFLLWHLVAEGVPAWGVNNKGTILSVPSRFGDKSKSQNKWVASWQNHQNDLSAQLRLISLGICWVWSVFPVCIKKHWALNYLLSTEWGVWRLIRLGDAQADLSVRWAHVILLVLSCGGSNCLCVRCPEFESWSGYVLFPPVTFGGLWGGGGVHARGSSSKRTVSSVPSRFGDKSN